MELHRAPVLLIVLRNVKEKGIRIGFITSTSQNNVNNLLNAVKDCINVANFELITTKEDVVAEKPAGDIYKYALEKFRLKPTEVIAVEDTEINQSAALQEEIFCYLFAGEYATTQHNINRSSYNGNSHKTAQIILSDETYSIKQNSPLKSLYLAQNVLSLHV